MEIIANYENACGECPVWDAATGTLYWTDSDLSKFFRYVPATGRHEMVHSGFQVSGFALNRAGGFVVTNTEGVWLWDGGGAKHRILHEILDRPAVLNDCTADPRGRLLTGMWCYRPDADYRPGYLIRVNPDGTSAILDEDVHGANGLGFSPDERTLYFTDTVTRTIWAYDYRVGDGSVANRRVFVKVPVTEGIPDGLAVDAQGFVWSGQWYGSCVVRYDPDGKVERRLHVPAKQVTSLTFAGPDLTDIYITTGGVSGALPIMPPGYDPSTGPFGGPLYRVNPGIRGKLPYRCDFPAA